MLKKILKKIYRRVTWKSNPVIDIETGRKEIMSYTEFFGFVIRVSYKPV